MTVGAMDLPPEGMLLGGVALAGDPARGTTNTEGLSLLFTSAGITVQGKQPESERLLPWAGLDAATCHDQTELPGGRTASVLVLTSGGQQVRFLLPPETVSPGQAAYLDQAMPAWLTRYRGTSAPTPTPAPTPAPAAEAPAAPAAAPAAAAAAAAVAAESHRPPAAPAAPAPPVVAPAPPLDAPPAPPTVATGPPTAPTPAVDEFAVPPLLGVPPEPAIDPVTGAAVWADPDAPAVEEGKGPKKSRKARKAEAVAAAAAAATAGLVATDAPAPPAPPVTDAPHAPYAPDGPPPADPLSPLPPEEGAAAGKESSRRTLAILVALLALVVIVGVFLLVNRHNNSTSTATTAPSSSVPAGAQDKALAESIDLRLSDLPAGWTRATSSAATAPPPPTTPAVSALATCLGLPTSTVNQLFGTATQTDVSATSASPVFSAPGDPTTLMQSSTNVVRSDADASADSAPFANPNFTTCFQAYLTTDAATVKAGTTATVTQVTLSAPTGVKSYGYLTTYTVPGGPTKVQGYAFIVGGRIEATLVPTTAGTPVPGAAFTSAYNGIVGRVAAHANS